jgi:hypothetical protein
MLDFIINFLSGSKWSPRPFSSGSKRNPNPGKNTVPRPSLYCVWIRAHEGENAPLIRVWIDPSMSMFDSQAKVHEPDLAAARAKAEEEIACSREGTA